ncbi:MAG: hypothetical protein FWG07_07950 [Treponema sp.]|nr:hypothetical protein [Treponema sp.]
MNKDELNDGRVTFYYSREERLKRASKPVRDINNQVTPQKKGLFRTLTATKPLTFLFISIITICAAFLIMSRFLNAEGVRVIGNNTITVSVIGAGENSYITVKKTVRQKSGQGGNTGIGYAGPVDIAVSVSGEGNPIHAERLYFGPEQEEIFRIIAPFRGKKLIILMEAGAERIYFTISSE